MKRLFISFLILSIISILISPASAASNTVCLSTSTLEKNISTTTYSNGTISNISLIQEQTTCPYGCTNNQCTPAATLNQWNSLVLAILFAAILGAGVYAESNPLIILSGLVGMIFAVALGTQGILFDSVLVKNSITGGLGAALAFGSLYLIIGSVAEWRTKNREE